MLAFTLSDREEYVRGVARFEGEAREWFAALATECLQRFTTVNGAPVPPEQLKACALRIWTRMEAVGWPEPLPPDAVRAAQDRSIPELESWVALAAREPSAEVPSAMSDVFLSGIRQLFKACLYPEFTVCRESYRQTTGTGVCKRQVLAVAAARLSGSPCVDCPYTVSLTSDQHRQLLERAWVGPNKDAFKADQMCFLPEDFRALRRFLWLHARCR